MQQNFLRLRHKGSYLKIQIISSEDAEFVVLHPLKEVAKKLSAKEEIPLFVSMCQENQKYMRQVRYGFCYMAVLMKQKQAKLDFISLAYEFDQNSSSQIYDFEKNYTFENMENFNFILRQYSKDAFFYKILNSGLKHLSHPFDYYYLRLPFVDLYQTIMKQYRKQLIKRTESFRAYKRCSLSQKQFKHFKNNVGKYIQMQGFLRAYESEKVAESSNQEYFLQIHVPFQNQVSEKIDSGFTTLENFREEKLIIFNAFNIFQVASIRQKRLKGIGITIPLIKLVYTRIDQIRKKQYKSMDEQNLCDNYDSFETKAVTETIKNDLQADILSQEDLKTQLNYYYQKLKLKNYENKLSQEYRLALINLSRLNIENTLSQEYFEEYLHIMKSKDSFKINPNFTQNRLSAEFKLAQQFNNHKKYRYAFKLFEMMRAQLEKDEFFLEPSEKVLLSLIKERMKGLKKIRSLGTEGIEKSKLRHQIMLKEGRSKKYLNCLIEEAESYCFSNKYAQAISLYEKQIVEQYKQIKLGKYVERAMFGHLIKKCLAVYQQAQISERRYKKYSLRAVKLLSLLETYVQSEQLFPCLLETIEVSIYYTVFKLTNKAITQFFEENGKKNDQQFNKLIQILLKYNQSKLVESIIHLGAWSSDYQENQIPQFLKDYQEREMYFYYFIQRFIKAYCPNFKQDGSSFKKIIQDKRQKQEILKRIQEKEKMKKLTKERQEIQKKTKESILPTTKAEYDKWDHRYVKQQRQEQLKQMNEYKINKQKSQSEKSIRKQKSKKKENPQKNQGIEDGQRQQSKKEQFINRELEKKEKDFEKQEKTEVLDKVKKEQEKEQNRNQLDEYRKRQKQKYSEQEKKKKSFFEKFKFW